MKTGENYKAEAFFKVEGHPSVMKMRAEMVLNGILEGDKEYAQQVIEMYELAFPAQGKKTQDNG